MHPISQKLNRIKSELKQKAEKEGAIRKRIRESLEKIFGADNQKDQFVSDFYMRSRTLIIEAKNKASANEIFLRRGEILESLKGTVREIIVY